MLDAVVPRCELCDATLRILHAANQEVTLRAPAKRDAANATAMFQRIARAAATPLRDAVMALGPHAVATLWDQVRLLYTGGIKYVGLLGHYHP